MRKRLRGATGGDELGTVHSAVVQRMCGKADLFGTSLVLVWVLVGTSLVLVGTSLVLVGTCLPQGTLGHLQALRRASAAVR